MTIFIANQLIYFFTYLEHKNVHSMFITGTIIKADTLWNTVYCPVNGHYL